MAILGNGEPFGAKLSGVPPQPKSMVDDAQRLVGSLRDLHGRLENLHDRLYGVRPRETGDPRSDMAAPIGAMPVARSIDDALVLVSRMFDEIGRIDGGL